MTLSDKLFERARQHIPGGVNSPVRSFNGVGGTPLFIQAAKGAYVIDADNKHYIDYVGSWGPMILGHTHDKVCQAVKESLDRGFSYGAPTQLEIELAEKITSFFPSIEMLRMATSGTEATMHAIRLARGFTGRNKIIKFIGCYHGAHDSVLVQAGSGALTLGTPSSPGIPEDFSKHTLLAQYNDLDSVAELFNKYGDDIAAIIVEPVAGNMGCVLPDDNFLPRLRELCDSHRSVLIFDEVMTGFRVALNGAQSKYNVTPDLTTLGKVIGGGLPAAAFGGKRAIMEHLSPLGPVYQAGTLSGNPIAVAAGLATLNELTRANFNGIVEHTQQLTAGLAERARKHNVPVVINQSGAMFSLFFTELSDVKDFRDVEQCDTDKFKDFFHGMLAQGIYLPPSAYECWFTSSAHQKEEITLTLQAADKVFATL
jgi:glutamate-1-semialdehyde 2,1-aminomutase